MNNTNLTLTLTNLTLTNLTLTNFTNSSISPQNDNDNDKKNLYENGILGIIIIFGVLSLALLVFIFSIYLKQRQYKGFFSCFIGETCYCFTIILTLNGMRDIPLPCFWDYDGPLYPPPPTCFCYYLKKRIDGFLECFRVRRNRIVGPSIRYYDSSSDSEHYSDDEEESSSPSKHISLNEKFNINEMLVSNPVFKLESETKTEVCAICTSPLCESQEDSLDKTELKNVILQLKCGHYFHHNCIDTWYKTSANKDCPLCKSEISIEMGFKV